jgi:hypothetical protein
MTFGAPDPRGVLGESAGRHAKIMGVDRTPLAFTSGEG